MVDPTDFEHPIVEAGFLVRDRREDLPVDGQELGVTPVVDALQVLDLRAIGRVGSGRATDVAQLGRKATCDGPVVHREGHFGGREKGNQQDRMGLSP